MLRTDELFNYVIDSVLVAVNGNGISAGVALKLILPQVTRLLESEWSAEVRLEAQGVIDRALRDLRLI